MTAIGNLLVVTWIGLFIYLAVTIIITISRYRMPVLTHNGDLPPCSIILPIKGISQYLESNLLALAKLDPFKGEILLALPRNEDSAAEVVASIVSRYPNKMKLMVGEAAEFANPKLRNVAKAYRASKEDVIVFLDDSAELTPALFCELLRGLKPEIVAVTAAPYGDDAENFFAQIEAATCNGYLFRTQMLFEVFGLAAVFGNALAFRKKDLESAGGFDRLAEGPCEDSAFSNALRGPGARISLLRSGIRRRIGKRSWNDVYLRHLRWMTCTKVHDPALSIAEPLIGGLCFNLLGAYVLSGMLEISLLGALLLSMAIWYGAESILHLACRWKMTFATPLGWLARDLLQPLFMLSARFARRIDWRGETIETSR